MDQADTEKHSREEESELLCNGVTKKAMPTNGKLCRSEEILRPHMTSACEELNKENFIKQTKNKKIQQVTQLSAPEDWSLISTLMFHTF